jgi:SAM-dependent methyltransferase
MLFKNIKDTQCGFKMFAKDAVGPLFSRNYLNRFGFDVEILYLAHKMGYRVKEGPISWRHVGGSKVNLITDSISMFMNILQVRNWHCTPINPSDKNIGPDVYKYMHDLESYHWWFVSRNYLAAHLINSFHMPTPHILDIGCGAGASLASFMKLGEAYGIDISQKAVDFCHKQGFINVSLSAPENICFNDKRFDIIACLYLLARAVNPIDALLDIRRALKDSGKVIIMVPAFRMLWSRHDNALGHLRRYEKKQLIHDLNEAGLKIDKIGYFFFLSFFLVAPIRIMRKFFSANKKNKSDTSTLPPKIINEFLKLLFKMEIAFSDIFSLPFGTTLYAIASKNFS